MLVPVQGGTATLGKRNRTIHDQEAAIATVGLPNVYIYNVGPREWKGIGGGKEYKIPACPKGARYSKPVAIPILVLSERDLADGGNNMDTIMDSGVTSIRKVGGEDVRKVGVADDVIGTESTSPDLGLYTTNGKWFGVFYSRNLNAAGEPEPLDEEVDAARDSLHETAKLIYQTGADKVAQGDQVPMKDRERFNWSAEFLAAKPLWGNLDHTMQHCPLCQEDIREGAKVCKHCGNAIDEASLAARAAKLAEENGEEEKPAKPAKPAPRKRN